MSEEGKKSSEKGSCCGPRCCGIAGTIGAIIFAVLAIILPFIVSDIIDKVIFGYITTTFLLSYFIVSKATEASSWNSYERLLGRVSSAHVHSFLHVQRY